MLSKIFFWKRFDSNVSKLEDLDAVTMVDVVVRGERKKKKSYSYIPRAWRWAGVKQAGNKSLVNVIHKEEEFSFRSNFFTPRGTSPLSLFRSTTRRSFCLVRIH